MKHCQACNAPILLMEGQDGRSLVLDAQPSPDGPLVLLENAKGTAYVAVPFSRGYHRSTAPRYKPHASTCRDLAFDDWLAQKERNAR